MQERHLNRKIYFNELAKTSSDYYLDYVSEFMDLTPQCRVLEIGCGEGGNLLPFAQKGCQTTGIDLNAAQIENAKCFFEEQGLTSDFIYSDFLKAPHPENIENQYDLVLIHDVIEHIEAPDKPAFFEHLKRFMKPNALVFFGFPAWQMPFGGHQQICENKLISKIPFIHLLPEKTYHKILEKAGENEARIDDLLSIKRSKMPVERFERLAKAAELKILKRTLWVINPHYKVKFHLIPLREIWPFTQIPYLRNFYTTSAWYLLRK